MTAPQVWRIAAVLFAALGGFSAVIFARLRWTPQTDFDIIGFLWLLQNVPRLTALAFTVLFFAMAVWCWIRSFGSLR